MRLSIVQVPQPISLLTIGSSVLMITWINNYRIKDEINGGDGVAGGTTHYIFLTMLIYEDR